jgi:hypothetical protein
VDNDLLKLADKCDVNALSWAKNAVSECPDHIPPRAAEALDVMLAWHNRAVALRELAACAAQVAP